MLYDKSAGSAGLYNERMGFHRCNDSKSLSEDTEKTGENCNEGEADIVLEWKRNIMPHFVTILQAVHHYLEHGCCKFNLQAQRQITGWFHLWKDEHNQNESCWVTVTPSQALCHDTAISCTSLSASIPDVWYHMCKNVMRDPLVLYCNAMRKAHFCFTSCYQYELLWPGFPEPTDAVA